MLNLNNPLEVRKAGIKALSDAIGPLGMARFLQQYEPGYGDYTKEKYEEPDISWDEFAGLLNKYRAKH